MRKFLVGMAVLAFAAVPFIPKAQAVLNPVGVGGPSDVGLYHPGKKATSLAPLAGGDAANAYVDRVLPDPSIPISSIYAHGYYVEQTSNSSGYFYSTQFGFENGGTMGGYIGIQSILLDCYDGVGCYNRGHGFIFSIFGATGCQSVPSGGACFHGTNEGDFYSIHLPNNWSTNTQYAMSLSQGFTFVGGVYVPNGIVCGTVIQPGVTSWSMGCFNVPTSPQTGFSPNVYQWTEEYLPGNYADCNTIPQSRALFSGNISMQIPYPHYNQYLASASTPHIASGAGVCTNSASLYVDTQSGCGTHCDRYRLIIGATS